MTELAHRYHSPWKVARQLWAGKSLTRALFNLAVEGREVGGRILDLGAKSAAASYYRHLRVRPGSEILFTDLAPAPGVVRVDVEQDFGLDAEAFDQVLAIHLFEHVYQYQGAPSEIARVLKPGGRFLVVVPFLHEYHGDPDDFFRMTHTALRRWGESGGLRCIELLAVGEGIATFALTKLAGQTLPSFLKSPAAALLYLVATWIDRLAALRPPIGGLKLPQRFALEYLGVFEKPACREQPDSYSMGSSPPCC